MEGSYLAVEACQFTSRLVGEAYAAAGQAGDTRQTISVLQAYQADLLKEAEIEELRSLSDLALRVTKQAACAIGCSLVALIVTERHFWLNLIEKDRSFVLDAPVLPAGLFGSAAETVVRKFREAWRLSQWRLSATFLTVGSILPVTHLILSLLLGPADGRVRR